MRGLWMISWSWLCFWKLYCPNTWYLFFLWHRIIKACSNPFLQNQPVSFEILCYPEWYKEPRWSFLLIIFSHYHCFIEIIVSHCAESHLRLKFLSIYLWKTEHVVDDPLKIHLVHFASLQSWLGWSIGCCGSFFLLLFFFHEPPWWANQVSLPSLSTFAFSGLFTLLCPIVSLSVF